MSVIVSLYKYLKHELSLSFDDILFIKTIQAFTGITLSFVKSLCRFHSPNVHEDLVDILEKSWKVLKSRDVKNMKDYAGFF